MYLLKTTTALLAEKLSDATITCWVALAEGKSRVRVIIIISDFQILIIPIYDI